ncbi:MAG: DUF362 domain-containing protein [Bacillota bacterium]
MNENIVVVSSCENYESENVKKSILEVFEQLDGLDKQLKNAKTVVIKPNLLLGKTPEESVTTHPSLLKEVIDKLKEYNCNIVIGDSPGGPFNEMRLKSIYKKTGLYELAEKKNVKLNYDTSYSNISFKEGFLVKSFQVATFIKEADLIINMPKLKTHSFMRYTGAVKNLFGVIPGIIKAEYHLRMPEAENFALMLVDLARLISPQVNIMDAVYGMHGAGPSSGDKIKIGYVIASSSCFALDVAGAHLLNISALDVPTINQGSKKGIFDSLDKLKLYGDELKSASNTIIPDIDKNDTKNFKNLPPFITKIINALLKPRPVFNYDKCVKCGDCAANCPAEAIKLDEYPKVDLDLCIRCYCCQELCSFEAVNIKRPFLGKLFFK